MATEGSPSAIEDMPNLNLTVVDYRLVHKQVRHLCEQAKEDCQRRMVALASLVVFMKRLDAVGFWNDRASMRLPLKRLVHKKQFEDNQSCDARCQHGSFSAWKTS